MNLIIEEYWERTSDEINPQTGLRDVFKGEYVLKRTTDMGKSWDSVSDYSKARTKAHDFIEEVEPGCFKFDRGSHWGIHSYHIVYPCGKPEQD